MTKDLQECAVCHAFVSWEQYKLHMEWHDDITNNFDIIAKLLAKLMGLPEEEMWAR